MISTNDAVSLLENGLLGVPMFELSELKKDVEEFQNILTNCRMSLKSTNEAYSEELEFILRDLKIQISGTLQRIERQKVSKVDTNYYKCSKCGDVIYTDTKRNLWDYLQCHSHFEDMYFAALSNSNDLSIEEFEPTLNDSNVVNTIGHDSEASSDSESDIHDDTMIDMNNVDLSGVVLFYDTISENDINSFRFNFELYYDEVISSKLYPDGLVKAVQRIDKCKDPTILRVGGSKAVCLLCGVQIMGKSRITKAQILDHVIGQRHLSLTVSDRNIDILRRYHELWLNFECYYQAHQVFFIPKRYSLQCILCKKVGKGSVKNHYSPVKDHIDSDDHKNRLINMCVSSPNLYYLAYEQAQVYNLSVEVLEKMLHVSLNGKNKKNSATQDNKRSVSDPSTSADPTNKANPKAKKGKKAEMTSHNIIKSVTIEGSSNMLDLLPNRLKNNGVFLVLTAEGILCKACDVILNKSLDIVRKHIKNEQHLRLTGLETINYDYYCEICNIKVDNENAWEKHLTIGPNNHINMAESRKSRVTEYECTVCHTVIYGDELSLARHLSVKSGKRKKSQKEIKLPDAVKKMLKSKEFIDVQCQDLTYAANCTAESNELTLYCCQRLEVALSSYFPECKAYPFGSRISGLGHTSSDLDVFIDVGDMYTGTKNQDAQSQVTFVRKAANQLSKYKKEFLDITKISGARTPIVQVYHALTNIDCDLSFRHGLSVENTKFLRFCIKLQPITQPLILMIKEWSEINALKDHDHVSNYLLSVMAIFFLQTEQYLLSIKRLREINIGEHPVINGWETINYTTPIKELQQLVEPCKKSITELLKAFFQYYATFSYDSDVVCPLLGYTLRKTAFETNSGLPPEMKSYVNKLRSQSPELFKYTALFCVQDPFDLSHNLSKAWQASTANKFKALCNLSYQHLNSL
nr:unnamed protein product [Callosobruchus chinensis]